mmetsp:Transcript_35567/g.49378  ORF Transcript_35567/g.49378 Transcript_35567/m.49378 type:complete len:975 (+) Transcript_35567:126-3050(+)|eukprot:CAMPEP_0196582774 /NCGR_PEP_ID=MMETSP1081-20130531/40591_1 /TAXON_ID=36882 /ORGANISM="Pyramimonas amylifera, Strain CCMP720" /LENGTH=974 /DNA_ID=CAMNT_0041903451 /DNA_START=126 /DNA_END=3050 /DNA_ORIENTATION=-
MSSDFVPNSILLTGGAGFIASHVALLILKKYPQYKVVVLDKLDYCSSLKNFDALQSYPNFKFIKGDICTPDLVNYILTSENIDTVMHFAAQSHVDNSFGNSFDFTMNNIYGTHVLLEGARVVGGIRRFIHVSTDEVYGESSMDYVDGNTESHALEPTNPYAATKAGAEMLVKAYMTSYKLPCITTRGNNVYGPQQYPEKLIPKFVLLAKRGCTLPIHGNGLNTRSYLHVDDVARAFDLILHKGVVGEIYNVGTKQERTVLSVAQTISKYFKLDTHAINYVEDRMFNDQRYYLETSKLSELGWEEKVPWEEGIRTTIEWYLKHGETWFLNDISSALQAHPTKGTTSITGPVAASHLPPSTSHRFLVFGRTGWIGGLLGQLLTEEGAIWEFANCRLQDRSTLEAELDRVKPTHVLNAAGVTGRPNVDWCESHTLETIRSNVVGTLTLCDVCNARSIHMTNFATGCIFEYDKKHPMGSGIGFTEEEEANFTGSFYSFTKALVESLVNKYENVLTLRVRMPITSDLSSPRNFVYKIANYDRVVDIPNSMTVLDEMLPISIEMAKRNLTGIYNFTNPGTISHNEVLALYKQYVDPSYTWKNFSLEEQARILAAPRSNNELDCTKLLKEFPDLKPIKTSFVENVFKQYVANGSKPIVNRSKPPVSQSIPPPEVVAPAVVPADGKPRFLVFGRTGWIGGLLGQLLSEEGAIWEYASCRLQNRSAVEAELDRFKPSHVLNAAGVTGRPNVDWCETHPLETIRTNVVGTLILCDSCEIRGIHMTNFATGCIFEYDSEHPLGSGKGFTEEDKANFTGSYYSFTKAHVESLMKSYSHVLTLRVRMPITSDLSSHRNFVYKIANYDRVVDIPNSMTVLDEMLPISIEMAKRRLTGIFNFTNPGTISHNEVLSLYKQYVDPQYTWKNFSLEEQTKILAAPRSNNELDTTKLIKEFPNLKPVRDSYIENVFKKYVKQGGKGIVPTPRV